MFDDDLAKQVEDAATLGARYPVCSSPKPQTPPRQGVDWAQRLTAAAAYICMVFVEQHPPFDQPPLHGLHASLAYLRPLGTSAARFGDTHR